MRKRSSYRPRELRNPLTLLQPAGQSALDRCVLGVWSALDAMIRGTGDRQCWEEVATAASALEVAYQQGRADDSYARISADAEGALRRVRARVRQGKGWALDGPGIEACRRAVTCYDEMLAKLNHAHLQGVLWVNVSRRAQAERECLAWLESQDRTDCATPPITLQPCAQIALQGVPWA